jgi:8-oxo-dGTP pyrophosphatase MutT (NUDIX family)
MKNPPRPSDGKRHDYCIACFAENPVVVDKWRRHYFKCLQCGHRAERRLVLDPRMRSRVAADGEYWHESAGVFVRNPDGKFLFFRRRIYPVRSVTVASGHVDTDDESPAAAAVRELTEETGLRVDGVVWIASDDIVGDSCRRGSDAHKWHTFGIAFDSPIGPKDLTVNEEIEKPVWLTLDKALRKKLTFPVRYVIERHKAELESFAAGTGRFR